MAAARDQAARIFRAEPDTAEGDTARDASAALADQLRSHVSDETVARRPAETPGNNPSIDKPAAAPDAATVAPAAAKSGKRKLVLMGIVTLLAAAAAGYGGCYILQDRFYGLAGDATVGS